ncbi:MAG: LemA family protein [Odoribacter sp.]|nr:LemA family protein [Odoribacter sp.]
MKKSYTKWVVAGVILLAVVIIVGWWVRSRNSFVSMDENLTQAWGQVENQYQRRLDLIPNLVETVKGYAAHESETLESVTRARAGLTDAYNDAAAMQQEPQPATEQAMDNYAAAQSRLKDALSIYVNAVREAYPDLKANQNFLDLQTQLEGTENRIATERQRYIEAVRDYNVAIRTFPASMVASMSGFDVKPQFKAEQGAATAPKVSF